MNDLPEISVVMSACNDAAHLPRAIESILSQEGVGIEFIIVNDGSTDGSERILGDYARRDPRIRVLEQSNRGLTLALIRGCAEARGEFIARQDADDESMPGRLQRLARRLNSDARLAFASSWAQTVGPEGELMADLTRPEDPVVATSELLDQRIGPPGHGSVMFRRRTYEEVGGYRPEFYYGQDSDLWLRLAARDMIAYEQAFLYRFRYDPRGISGRQRRLQKLFGEIGRECHAARRRGESEEGLLAEAAKLKAGILASRGTAPSSGMALSAGYYFVGAALERRGDVRAAGYLWQAIRRNPLHARAWAKLARLTLRRGRRRMPGGMDAAPGEKRV